MGDWRAILICGHRQHIRHNPPLVSRPWVLTEEGRQRFLGVALDCKACDEGEPVNDAMVSPAALEAVYGQIQSDLMRFIRLAVTAPGVAESILQDATLRIHAQANALHEGDRLADWLYQIVHEVMGDRDKPLPPADNHDAAAALADAVRGLFACLPGAYRQALILIEYQGLPPWGIADRLDIPLVEVKSRVQKGREMLLEALLDWCHFAAESDGWVLPYRAGCPACVG